MAARGRMADTSAPEQVEQYKYLVWVPGNCASVRLAKQLAADALVMKLDSDEVEWYYPLLRPNEHFVPIWVNRTAPDTNLSQITASSVGIAEAVRWAEAHPLQVSIWRWCCSCYACGALAGTQRASHQHNMYGLAVEPWNASDRVDQNLRMP